MLEGLSKKTQEDLVKLGVDTAKVGLISLKTTIKALGMSGGGKKEGDRVDDVVNAGSTSKGVSDVLARIKALKQGGK